MHWFRVYNDIIDDPKVLQLSAEMRWYYVGILAISSRQSQQNLRGFLPKLEDISLHLRLSGPKTFRVVRTLIQAGLIDQQFNGSPENTRLSVHGWNDRQFLSDDVGTRVRKHRAKAICNVTRVRATDTDTETDTETDSLSGGEKAHPISEPIQKEIIEIATQRWGASNGDSVVNDLLRDYEADLLREAIDRHWDQVGKALHPARLRAYCKTLLANGWKPGQPSQGRSSGSVPYKPEGPVPPSVKPMTEKERAIFKAEGDRLRKEYRERLENGRKPRQKD